MKQKKLTQKQRDKKIKQIIIGEIRWLKVHRNKLDYKILEKLKEYTDNRIEFLKKLEKLI